MQAASCSECKALKGCRRFALPRAQASLPAVAETPLPPTLFADVNECNPNPCGPHSTCTNTIGAFQCGCVAGYTWNGTSCIGGGHFCRCCGVGSCSAFKAWKRFNHQISSRKPIVTSTPLPPLLLSRRR
jgi:hypothetical protein